MSHREVLKKQLSTWESIKRIETQAAKVISKLGGKPLFLRMCNKIPDCYTFVLELRHSKTSKTYYQTVMLSSNHCFKTTIFFKEILETQS